MTGARCDHHGDLLYRALRERAPIDPLTAGEPDLTLAEAYRISLRLLSRRLADGERVIGKKIGVTSGSVQRMLGVFQPDFGYLTDRMQYTDGAEVPLGSALIQPRAEGEVAFVLHRDLLGPGVTPADVLAATARVVPCFEIVDSRIRDWRIRIQDTVADNASSGVFVLGRGELDPRELSRCTMAVRKNGQVVSTGAGEAVIGSPAACVAWLANTLGSQHPPAPLRAGEIILSGSWVPLEPVRPGDRMELSIYRQDQGQAEIGSAAVRFV